MIEAKLAETEKKLAQAQDKIDQSEAADDDDAEAKANKQALEKEAEEQARKFL